MIGQKPADMNITVVLCTHNRSECLASALESAAAMVLPESVQWEILVVDNNSSDSTREVVTEFSNRYPGRFRYLFEPQPGKSHALNAGIRYAQGEIMAFLDDDVTVEPAWLQNLTAGLRSGTWAGAGGRIIPKWPRPAPRWLSPKAWYASGPLVQFDLGDKTCELSESPFGTNMAFRKAMFEKYGDFRVELGPRPGSEIRNEDTEFGSRLLAAGERLNYEPSAIVYHPVQENRIEKQYFLTWWFHKGEAGIRQLGVRPGTKYFIAGVPLYLFRNLAVWTVRWMLALSPSQRFSGKLSVWYKVGEILECHRQSVAARKKTENCRAS
jgi:glycosyltransferase involved in cell wall biosynthesis